MEDGAANSNAIAGSLARDPMADLADDLVALIKPELAPGERVLWAAKSNPRDGGSFSSALLFAPTFLLVGLACIGLTHSRFAPWFRQIDGLILGVGFVLVIVFVFMVMGIVSSWFEGRYERRTLKEHLYVLTDRRAIVWIPQAGSAGVQVRTIQKGTVQKTSRVEYPDGSGDLYLEPDSRPFKTPPTLAGIPDVRRVEDLVRSNLIDPEPTSETPSPRDPR